MDNSCLRFLEEEEENGRWRNMEKERRETEEKGKTEEGKERKKYDIKVDKDVQEGKK